MRVIGLVAEYNPFHNGHAYQIKKIKELYPDSLIICILGGNFTQRGDISILPKITKGKIALDENIDIILELPTLYTVQSADIFAYQSIKILNKIHIDTLVFGSECNDITLLKSLAAKQEEDSYQKEVKSYLEEGLNYPTALAKALKVEFDFNSNDLLGISYIKAVNKINPNIQIQTIKRTNNYLDITSNEKIISASNIRNKFLNNELITKYTSYSNYLIKPNYSLYFNILKTKIMTDSNLNSYLDVSEGLDFLLKKVIIKCQSLEELITKIKTKRYTYSRINRMLIHILLGIKKDYPLEDYLRILAYNQKGKKYIKGQNIKENYKHTICYKYELISASIYDILTNSSFYQEEIKNKPFYNGKEVILTTKE